jgi:hypothetical protein
MDDGHFGYIIKIEKKNSYLSKHDYCFQVIMGILCPSMVSKSILPMQMFGICLYM